MRQRFWSLIVLTAFGATLAAAPAAAQALPPVDFGVPVVFAQDPAPQDVPKSSGKGPLGGITGRLRDLMKSDPDTGVTPIRRGFYLKFGGITTGSGWAVGPGYRYESIGGGPVDFDAFARVSWKKYWQVESRLSMPRLNNGTTLIRAFARLRDMPQEDFYGFGIDTHKDDRVSYGLREAMVGLFAQQHFGDSFRVHGAVEHARPRTREGGDNNYPSIEERFDVDALPGFEGFNDETNFTVLRAGAMFDRTDFPGNPRRGPQYLAEYARWRANSDGSSFTSVHVDLRQYIPIFTDMTVLALRGAGTETRPEDGGEVPLYYQPWIGGGKALRAYRDFRFRDRTAVVTQAELRQMLAAVFEDDVRVDAVVYIERGAVGREFGELEDWKSNWGIGLRAGSQGGVFFRLEGAFGGVDGTRWMVKFGNPW